MHPSLRLSDLDWLPLYPRRIAMAACAPHPSAANIERFAHCLEANPQQAMDFLPVFYSLLDPVRIPTAEQLDSCSAGMISTVYAASTSIQALFSAKISPELGPDMWPRVWQWTEFLYTFREFLDALTSPPSEEQLCLGLLDFNHHLWRYAPNRGMVTSTSGFQAMVVRAWTCSLRVDDLARNAPTSALFSVHKFLSRGPVLLDDRIEGAGGTIHDFAQLVIKHFDLIATRGDAPWTPNQLLVLKLVLDIVLVTDGIDVVVQYDLIEQSHPSEPTDLHPLSSALASPAFVEALTIHARTLSDTMPADDLGIVNKCFALLIVIFKIPTGSRSLRVSIQHGLLLAIVACAKGGGSGNLHDTLRLLLAQVITPASIHYHVLTDLATASIAASQEIGSHSFQRPDVYAAWNRSVSCIEVRLEVLRAFDSEKEYLSRAACDNIECGIILEKARLKSCAGCRNMLYCSIPCQRRDWESGHRESCVFHCTYRASIDLAYTSREYAFLRALLHHDYQLMRDADYYKIYVKGWAAQPDSALFTTFDYKLDGLTLSVQHAHGRNTDQEYWADMFARAFRSSGRMEVHVMAVTEGCRTRNLLIPLRRPTSPELPDAVRQLAADLGFLGEAQLQEQLISLASRHNKGHIH
ncbi:hypothetical protein DFH06DRAFT_1436084 [Mycena polygramma]|nr:hypothetical protein DFH06DRAFT_1436084 [Mycena polygramma]